MAMHGNINYMESMIQNERSVVNFGYNFVLPNDCFREAAMSGMGTVWTNQNADFLRQLIWQ